MGLFNSLQFSSMNTMAYADVDDHDTAMASTLASTMQQMSLSFGLACGSLVTGYYLSGLPQSDALAVTRALHHAFLTLASLTVVSSLAFWTLTVSYTHLDVYKRQHRSQPPVGRGRRPRGDHPRRRALRTDRDDAALGRNVVEHRDHDT